VRSLAPLLLALAAGIGCAGTVGDAPGDATPPPSPDDPLVAELLSLHDAARAAASPTPSPPLSPLGWSAAAASAAQAWANGCSWGHDAELGALGMGQNIFAVGSTSAAVSAAPADVVGSWVSEASSYHYDTNTCDAGKVCGHYTAVVWRSTTSVGCGHTVCHANSPFGAGFPHWDYWVCNYAPPGNWVGQRPY
jgi:hypothetical protein